MICALTNNVSEGSWSDAMKKRTARHASWKLGEIDSPAVTNFFRWFNDEYNLNGYKVNSIAPMF